MKTTNFLKMFLVVAMSCGAAILWPPQPAPAQMAGMQQASLQSFPAPSSRPSKVNPNDYVVGG
jgi:hypothetical protein